jgi:hypothetical protein
VHDDPAARPDCGAVAHVPPTPFTLTAAVEVGSTVISNVVFAALLPDELLPEFEEPLLPELLFDELPPETPVHFDE